MPRLRRKPPGRIAPSSPGRSRGQWGFDSYKGPAVHLQQVPGSGWRIVTAADTNLIIGQPNHLQLAANGTACIRQIDLEPGDTKVDWKLAPAKEEGKDIAAPPVDLTLNLQHAATPGSIHLAIQQYGEWKSGRDRDPNLQRAGQDRRAAGPCRRCVGNPDWQQPRPGEDGQSEGSDLQPRVRRRLRQVDGACAAEGCEGSDLQGRRKDYGPKYT